MTKMSETAWKLLLFLVSVNCLNARVKEVQNKASPGCVLQRSWNDLHEWVVACLLLPTMLIYWRAGHAWNSLTHLKSPLPTLALARISSFSSKSAACLGTWLCLKVTLDFSLQNSIPCDLCKELVTVADKVLKDNGTEVSRALLLLTPRDCLISLS